MKHSSHLKHMLIGGSVLLVGMLLLRVPLAAALPYAALLACPLMMVWMMFAMFGPERHDSGGLTRGLATDHRARELDVPAPEHASTVR